MVMTFQGIFVYFREEVPRRIHLKSKLFRVTKETRIGDSTSGKESSAKGPPLRGCFRQNSKSVVYGWIYQKISP